MSLAPHQDVKGLGTPKGLGEETIRGVRGAVPTRVKAESLIPVLPVPPPCRNLRKT